MIICTITCKPFGGEAGLLGGKLPPCLPSRKNPARRMCVCSYKLVCVLCGGGGRGEGMRV